MLPLHPPDVSLRGAKRRGNLGKAVAISPVAFPRCSRVLRDCHVGLRPPRNDKLESLYARRKCLDTCNCQRRSLSAATGPVGAIAFLTSARTSRQCAAGRGMPLPYNAWPKARELFILHFSVFSIHLFLRAPPLQRTSGSLVKFYTTKYPPFPDTGCRFRRYIPFFRRDYRRGGGQNRTPFSPRPPA